MNNEFKNYYKILGVTQYASMNSIENAARREMEYANPFQRELIREAASVLMNYESRARYDEIYNKVLTQVERLRGNTQSESDLLAVSKMENKIKQLEKETVETLKQNAIDRSDYGAAYKINKRINELDDELQVEENQPKITPEEKEKAEPSVEPVDDNDPTNEEPKKEAVEEEQLVKEENIESKKEVIEEGKPEEKVELEEDSIGDKKQLESQENEKMESYFNEAKIRSSNRKRILKNALIIGGCTVFFGLPVGIISAIILGKKGKLKLQKVSKEGKIKEVNTDESEFIKMENKLLEEDIDKLLNSPLNDNQNRYKLELAKLKYEHQINLLQKRIEFKKEQKSELSSKAYNRLYVLALEIKYAAAIKFLEARKKMAEAKLNTLETYNPSKSQDGLTKIQNEIEAVQKELEDSNLSDLKRNNKLVKLNDLNVKRLEKIDKMSLKKNGISRNQVMLAFFDNPKKFVTSLFSRKEEQTEETIDITSSSKMVH